MKIPKLKTPFAIFPTVFLPALGMPHFSGHPIFTAVCVGVDAICLTWMIASHTTSGDYIGSGLSRAEKKRALRLQRIRELEAAEGLEPLDLDWPEGLLEELGRDETGDGRRAEEP